MGTHACAHNEKASIYMLGKIQTHLWKRKEAGVVIIEIKISQIELLQQRLAEEAAAGLLFDGILRHVEGFTT